MVLLWHHSEEPFTVPGAPSWFCVHIKLCRSRVDKLLLSYETRVLGTRSAIAGERSTVAGSSVLRSSCQRETEVTPENGRSVKASLARGTHGVAAPLITCSLHCDFELKTRTIYLKVHA